MLIKAYYLAMLRVSQEKIEAELPNIAGNHKDQKNFYS